MYIYTQLKHIYTKGRLMQKTERMEAVKRIISGNRIRSQEQLLTELYKEGFDVTQATLSRDLKYLKVAKVPDGAEGYLYSVPGYKKTINSDIVSSVYIEDLKRGFISIAFSGNICMLKTLVGHANSVAAAVDNLSIPGILGTVAGDDTIFMLLSETADKNEIETFFRSIE